MSPAQSLLDEPNNLFLHDAVTPFYLRDGILPRTADLHILDAGCGSGFRCDFLATANPGAKIAGIDFSPKSVEAARTRLGDRAEILVASLQDLPLPGRTFDYINCNEVLYLLDDTLGGLRALAASLKPTGILRVNLHSFWQRTRYFRAQQACELLGFFEPESPEEHHASVRGLMDALRPNVVLRSETWESLKPEDDQTLAMNFALHGDKGHTIPQLFGLLREAGLNFVSMVDWRNWELPNLWQNLPESIQARVGGMNAEQKLALFELLHPVNRLLDIWCTPAPVTERRRPLRWTPMEWTGAIVHLHPQLRTPKIQAEWEAAIRRQRPLDLRLFIPHPARSPIPVDSRTLACLYPLFGGPLPFAELSQRWLTLYPVEPLTGTATQPGDADAAVRLALSRLELFLYVLVEPCPRRAGHLNLAP